MSASLMSAAMYLPIPKPEKLLLAAMADHANDDGLGIYPGNDRLALKTSDSVRNTQKVRRRLEDAGLIMRYRYPFGGRGRTVEWAIDAETVYALARAAGWTQAKRGSSRTPFRNQKGGVTAQKGVNTAQKGGRGDTPDIRTVITTKDPPSIAEQNPRGDDEPLRDYLARIADLYHAQ